MSSNKVEPDLQVDLGGLAEGDAEDFVFDDEDVIVTDMTEIGHGLDGDDDQAKKVEGEELNSDLLLGLSSLKVYTDPPDGKNRKKRRTISNRFSQLISASPNNQMTQKIFRSAAAINSERSRQISGQKKYIIHPFSSFRWYWDMIMVVILLCDIIILPINISFYSEVQADGLGLDADSNHSLNIMMLFFDFIFMIDIVLNFRTGYLNEWVEKVILDGKEIAKHYARTWFVIDLLSSVPFDQFYMLSSSDEEGKNDGDAFLAFRILKLTKLLCLLRILRMLRLLRYVHRFEEAVGDVLHIDGSVIRVFNLILLILMISHWNGCIQYLVVFIADFPDESWVMIDGLKNATVAEKYTSSVFRAMSHMLSIGYGSKPPIHMVDKWSIMVSMMVGATFYALFIGHMSSLLVNMDASGRVYNEKVTQVKEYMKYRRLPMKLQQRVFDYYEHRYQRKYFDEDDILHVGMSHVLRKEVMSYNCQNLVKKVSFLSNGPPEFILDIIAHLKFEVFLPGDYIIEAGKRGSCMYFIEYGKVEVILPSGQVVNCLVDGSHFGEIALLKDERRVASVKAVEVCDCYRLTREHFNRVLQDFPYMRKHMEKVVKDRLSSIKRHSRTAEPDHLETMQNKDSLLGTVVEEPRPNDMDSDATHKKGRPRQSHLDLDDYTDDMLVTASIYDTQFGSSQRRRSPPPGSTWSCHDRDAGQQDD